MIKMNVIKMEILICPLITSIPLILSLVEGYGISIPFFIGGAIIFFIHTIIFDRKIIPNNFVKNKNYINLLIFLFLSKTLACLSFYVIISLRFIATIVSAIIIILALSETIFASILYTDKIVYDNLQESSKSTFIMLLNDSLLGDLRTGVLER